MGGRTMKKFGLDKYISNRRSLIEIGRSLKRDRAAVFETNDSRLWEQLRRCASPTSTASGRAVGSRARSVSEAYYVRCDETNNTPNMV